MLKPKTTRGKYILYGNSNLKQP